ncbi:MAG: FtsX-like permease family protein [Candidatus Bathyarchaeota archaeon]|nr:FtsX-like permease family protein [Candidatus Bathyarchaeota archaeon]
MGGRGGRGRVQFTFGDALRLGYWYINRRMDRAMINMASVALGISFLSTLMMTDAFYRAFALAGGERLSVETYQYWLMFVAIVVCVVGITNAMLIAVYERYREIGTMKCIGALDRHILLLFLVESLIQGTVGGAVGFAVGIVGALLSTGFTIGFDILLKVPATEFILLFGGSVLLSMILSVVATLYPAYRAAKLNPVEALSYEL